MCTRRWVYFRGEIKDGVGVHSSCFDLVKMLGRAIAAPDNVKDADKAVTQLQQLILDGQLADDRALDAAVTILEDVVSNAIPLIVTAAEDHNLW